MEMASIKTRVFLLDKLIVSDYAHKKAFLYNLDPYFKLFYFIFDQKKTFRYLSYQFVMYTHLPSFCSPYLLYLSYLCQQYPARDDFHHRMTQTRLHCLCYSISVWRVLETATNYSPPLTHHPVPYHYYSASFFVCILLSIAEKN